MTWDPVAVGTVGTSTAVQITGMDANTPCSVSGQGSPQLQIGGGSNPWVTSSTISPNFYINVRLTAPTAYSSTHTATLTIGTVNRYYYSNIRSSPYWFRRYRYYWRIRCLWYSSIWTRMELQL